MRSFSTLLTALSFFAAPGFAFSAAAEQPLARLAGPDLKGGAAHRVRANSVLHGGPTRRAMESSGMSGYSPQNYSHNHQDHPENRSSPGFRPKFGSTWPRWGVRAARPESRTGRRKSGARRHARRPSSGGRRRSGQRNVRPAPAA